jgi:hypothetical protein
MAINSIATAKTAISVSSLTRRCCCAFHRIVPPVSIDLTPEGHQSKKAWGSCDRDSLSMNEAKVREKREMRL